MRKLLLVLTLVLGAPTAKGQSTPTISLVTFGIGELVFERFGHNALWIQDPANGVDVAYHWGLFGFDEPNFLGRFLTGDNRYWMGPSSARALIERELSAGRPTTIQRLNLSPAQTERLLEHIRWNEREENKFYRYDYFQDNCSTRLRDALDLAVGGAIKRASDTVRTALSYRRETVRLTDGAPPLQLGIDIALGRPADAPLTAWQSFFIPMRLRDAIRDVTIEDATGAAVPLVAEERVIPLPPDVEPIPERVASPRIAVRYLIMGVLFAILVGGLTFLLPLRSAAWGLALFGATWSLLCGLIGVILPLAWLATKHVFWAYNENVLQFTPLSLFLVVLVPAAILSGRFVRPARRTAGAVLLLSLIGAVMSIVPGRQENHAIVALMVPVHFAIYFALRAALPRSRPA